MKKLLPLISIATMLLIARSGALQAQVLNDNSYNIEVHFLRGKMLTSQNPNRTYSTYIGRVQTDTDGIPTQLFSLGSWVQNNDPRMCYVWTPTYTNGLPDWGGTVDFKMGGIIADSPTSIFDWNILGWEKDPTEADICTYKSTVDANRINQIGVLDAKSGLPSAWFEHPALEVYSGPTLLRSSILKSTWRYAKGQKSAPLNFGVLPVYTILHHENSNRGNPHPLNQQLFQPLLGYFDDWTPAISPEFKNSNDVTYTFEIPESRAVNISTNFDPLNYPGESFQQTNFDTYIHLVKLNPDGSFNSYIRGDDNDNPNLRSYIGGALLCAGKYAIIVEGGTTGAQSGDFFLEIDNSAVYSEPGTISGNLVIPNPQEFNPTITSVTDPNLDAGTLITWEKKTTGAWSMAATGTSTGINGTTYTLPALTETTTFRRKFGLACGGEIATYSNESQITVVSPNGTLTGKVVGKTGVGVNNVTITAQRTTAVEGGIANKTYTTTTGADGLFSIGGLYYGSTASSSGATANFSITPSKGAHVFNFPSLNKTLSQLVPQQSEVNFIDNTVFSITGKVTQECTDCVGATPGNPIICNVENVEFLIDNTYLGNKSLSDGTYAITVENPGNYTIKPRLGTHKFELNERVITISDGLETPNVNFKDTTTHVISGYVKAGCDEYIGTTKLRFTQVLPDVGGSPVTGCLIKEITTNAGSGYYAIRLPAAKYKVSVETFTPAGSGSDLNGLTVKDFLNLIPANSLTKDINEANATLNLTYVRPPVLQLVGLDNVCTTPTPFALIEQNKVKVLTIKVWQGEARTCPAKDSIVYVNSNVELDDTNKEYELPNVSGEIILGLKGGVPNIVAPYFKTFDVQYTDVYKRAATGINRNVVVTGLKSDIGTFTTVTPQIPFKILHDPHGDQSYSFWESNQTSETAMRLFRTDSNNEGLWAEVKIGREFESGIAISTETSIWGSVKGSVDVGAYNATENESIMSISNTQNFSTADNEGVVGAKGDVYIGAAVNLKYSKTQILSYQAPCTLTLKADLIVAPDGFATEYIYTEGHILTNIIPTLKDFAANTNNSAATTNFYKNQIKVWEQIVSNNAKNKKRAKFDKNLSFDGAAGAISSTTTTTSTKSGTIEFGTEINHELAAEIGLEIGGSGVSGGGVMSMKMETGQSNTGTNIRSTTTGYVLDDDENGDYFSIDIKKDPVYDTPVFELVSGTSSCPWEEGTQPRDAMQLVATPNIVTGVAADGEAEFTLQLSNISQSGETRTYSLGFDQSSNPNGAEVKIGGSIVVGATPYTISSGGQVNVLVKVKRGASNVFSYPGLVFTLSDNCDGEISKSVALNAYFNSPCSPVTLFAPEDNWVNTSNTLPVQIKDYVKANLTSVLLEYSETGTSDWKNGFTKTSAELSADVAGTLVNWNVSNLKDGKYKLRLKLFCGTNNITYSNTVFGEIDRVAPSLLGIPEPTDANYIVGDVISAQYNENLGCANLNNGNAIVKNLTTNTLINAQLSCFQNNIIIVPIDFLGGGGDSIRVTLQNIVDTHGNVKSISDSWKFIVGYSFAATGNDALSLKPATPGLVLSQEENAAGTMDFHFELPVNATHDVLINYSVSGSANPATDYTVYYFPTNQPTSTQFSGTSGTITIKSGQKSAILKIDPTGDTDAEVNETITIKIAEGGDYEIGPANTLTATIVNDDGEDCENGGVVYQLTNNTAGNTSIAAGTYHKSLLESNGKVISPTNVTMKGARSIVMQPGFEVRSGAIFSAQIEGCPELVATSAYSVAVAEKPLVNQFQFISTANTETTAQPNVQFEPSVMTAQDSDKIYFEFTLEKEEVITLQLLDKYGAEHVKVIDNEQYNAGTFTVEIETAPLKKGDYFIRLLKADKKVYQAVKVQ